MKTIGIKLIVRVFSPGLVTRITSAITVFFLSVNVSANLIYDFVGGESTDDAFLMLSGSINFNETARDTAFTNYEVYTGSQVNNFEFSLEFLGQWNGAADIDFGDGLIFSGNIGDSELVPIDGTIVEMTDNSSGFKLNLGATGWRLTGFNSDLNRDVFFGGGGPWRYVLRNDNNDDSDSDTVVPVPEPGVLGLLALATVIIQVQRKFQR